MHGVDGSERRVVRALGDLVHAAPALLIAGLALILTPLTPLSAIGALSTALIAGLVWRGVRDVWGGTPTDRAQRGTALLAGPVLRAAVIVSSLRLDWVAIAEAGPRPWLVAGVAVLTGIASFAALSRMLRVRSSLAALVAIGTSVCGAAAIAAAAPRLRAREADVDVSVAIVSVLGAATVLAMLAGRSLFGLGDGELALWAGGALHEVAHVVAASAAAPAASDVAILTKLARVALLPLGLWTLPWIAPATGRTQRAGTVRVPGLVVAFFGVSLLGTLARVGAETLALQPAWTAVSGTLTSFANTGLAASMAAVGMRVRLATFRGAGQRVLALAVLGLLPIVAAALTATLLLR